jgi:hypothetical protein
VPPVLLDPLRGCPALVVQSNDALGRAAHVRRDEHATIKFSGCHSTAINLRGLVQIRAWCGTDTRVRSFNQSWGCSLDWQSTDLSIRRINPHGEIRDVANACSAGEHRRPQCSFFLRRLPCLWNQTYLQSSMTVINETITSASFGADELLRRRNILLAWVSTSPNFCRM